MATATATVWAVYVRRSPTNGGSAVPGPSAMPRAACTAACAAGGQVTPGGPKMLPGGGGTRCVRSRRSAVIGQFGVAGTTTKQTNKKKEQNALKRCEHDRQYAAGTFTPTVEWV